MWRTGRVYSRERTDFPTSSVFLSTTSFFHSHTALKGIQAFSSTAKYLLNGIRYWCYYNFWSCLLSREQSVQCGYLNLNDRLAKTLCLLRNFLQAAQKPPCPSLPCTANLELISPTPSWKFCINIVFKIAVSFLGHPKFRQTWFSWMSIVQPGAAGVMQFSQANVVSRHLRLFPECSGSYTRTINVPGKQRAIRDFLRATSLKLLHKMGRIESRKVSSSHWLTARRSFETNKQEDFICCQLLRIDSSDNMWGEHTLLRAALGSGKRIWAQPSWMGTSMLFCSSPCSR